MLAGLVLLVLAASVPADTSLLFVSTAVLCLTAAVFAYSGAPARPWVVATAVGVCLLVWLNTIEQRADPAVGHVPQTAFEHSVALTTILLWIIAMTVSLMHMARGVTRPATKTTSLGLVIAGAGAALAWVLIAWTLREALGWMISDNVVIGVATSLFAGFAVWAFQRSQEPSAPDSASVPGSIVETVVVIQKPSIGFMEPTGFPEAVYLTLGIWRSYFRSRPRRKAEEGAFKGQRPLVGG